MTEKLYYEDAYTEEFEASVISCLPFEEGFDVVLDKTAFFPEEGGQYSDKGMLENAKVIDVREKDGIIHHYTDAPLTVGSLVNGKIDFSERYEKMQCHTGEHILSGLIHKLHGLDNVGFHLGADDVTMDISAPLTRKELDNIEMLANEIIYKNIEVKSEFPSSDALSSMEYRSKLDLTANVRIVTIGDYDTCACCAPHVKYTGEIGLIKILDFSKLRGGIRIHIAAGRRAMRIFSDCFKNAQKISELISVPKSDIAIGVAKLGSDLAELKTEYSRYKIASITKDAENIQKTDGNLVLAFLNYSFDELIAFANIVISKIGGMLILLSGEDGRYNYVIASSTIDLKPITADINKSLLGRGGGRSNMIQGSFAASLDEIKKYFNL